MIDTCITLHDLNSRNMGNMAGHLGLEFTDINEDYLKARIPVDDRTCQPLRLLNGGASAALCETVGSMAAYLSIDRETYYALGLEIKCNHIRAVDKGWVTATATPIHNGKRSHVWQVLVHDDEGNLVTHCTHTVMIVELTPEMKERFKDLFFKVN